MYTHELFLSGWQEDVYFAGESAAIGIAEIFSHLNMQE